MKKDDMQHSTTPQDDSVSVREEVLHEFESASGKLEFRLKNDMLFHIVMQEDNEALISLVSSLLGLPKENITSAQVENPIDYSKASDGKEIILDLKVTVNNTNVIDIEIQVANYHYWPSRSVYYAARMLEEQKPEKDYSGLLPVTQIGIIDFNLFEGRRKFFSKYTLRDEDDGYLYSSILTVLVLDLNAADTATESDIKNGLVYWAKMFKASTWDEIKVICKEFPEVKGAAQAMYKAETDKETREAILAREKAILDEKAMINGARKIGREEGLAEGLAEGHSKGLEDQASATARNLAAMGLPKDQIAAAVGFSVEKVEEWINTQAV